MNVVSPRAARAALVLFLRAVSKPVCAVCFVQLLPEFGFMKPGPGGTASGAPPEAVTMER